VLFLLKEYWFLSLSAHNSLSFGLSSLLLQLSRNEAPFCPASFSLGLALLRAGGSSTELGARWKVPKPLERMEEIAQRPTNWN